MRTFESFRRWLQANYDELDMVCQYAAPDPFQNALATDTVEEAGRFACRFGAGHLLDAKVPILSPREALAILGRILAWADQVERPFFDSSAACNYLGITEQSLYDLVGRKRLIPLRGPRRTYRFTRQQLDEYLANSNV
jgi:excisionase family DNA binding protein